MILVNQNILNKILIEKITNEVDNQFLDKNISFLYKTNKEIEEIKKKNSFNNFSIKKLIKNILRKLILLIVDIWIRGIKKIISFIGCRRQSSTFPSMNAFAFM